MYVLTLKHCEVPDWMFDPVQLERGIEVEYEHTIGRTPVDRLIAKCIAKAHLLESPDYYRLLEEMEAKF